MTTLYGIPNCDTVKKARRWLDAHRVDYRFHDLRKDGLDRIRLQRWEQQLGWETMLNRRGTTWRRLPEDRRTQINRDTALAVMLEQPAMIRRPLLEHGRHLELGFSPDAYRALFG
jgi:Spx/MgsR family transcriptional regulator